MVTARGEVGERIDRIDRAGQELGLGRIQRGARDMFFAPCAIGVFYIAAGALSVSYTGIAFFWLFVALGVLLIATSLVLRRA